MLLNVFIAAFIKQKHRRRIVTPTEPIITQKSNSVYKNG